MNNCIQKAMEDQGITAAELARRSGVPYGTVYDVSTGKTKVEKMAVEKFLKIAHGLGMTAEELYYGRPPEREYADPRQEKLNSYYEQLNDESRGVLVKVARSYAKDAENRIIKDGAEDLDDTGMASVS